MALRSLTAEFEMGSGSRLLAQITGPAKDKHGPQAPAPADLTVRGTAGLRRQAKGLSHQASDPGSQIPQGRPAARAPARDSQGTRGSRRRLRPTQNHVRVRTWITRAIKPIERLVPVSSTRHRAYTSGLSTWSSSTALKGGLVSRWVSRLDAFSGYPVRT